MSPLLSRSSGSQGLTGGLPQVNLLPPEIEEARGLRVVKRWLGISLVVVLVVIAGLYGWAVLAQQDAEGELALVQDETERLLQEQVRYAEVPVVLATLRNSEDALWLATSTEVLWAPYLRAIAASAPDDVSLDSLAYSGASPLEPPQGPMHPLQRPHVGTLTFTARSLTLPDTAAWVDALNAVPGFADAWFSDASVTEQEESVYYVVNASVQVTAEAWAQRFVPEYAVPTAEPTEGEG